MDKGPGDILILDQAHFVGQTAHIGITHGGAQGGIRYTHHDIGIGRSLRGQQAAGFAAEGMHVAAFDVAVGAREIDVFHGTHRVSHRIGILAATQTVVVDGDHLAGFQVPDELGPHRPERTRLAAHHVSIAQTSQRQRPEAVFIAGRVDAVFGHDEEGESSLQTVQRLYDGEDARIVLREGALFDEVRQDFAVGGRVEQAAHVFQFSTQLVGVDDVAVVGQGEIARMVPEEEGLDVFDPAAARRGVADMADGAVARELGQMGAVEDLGHQAQALDTAQLTVLAHRNDATAFLSPVLERVQGVIGQFSGMGNSPDAKYATFFVKTADHFPRK